MEPVSRNRLKGIYRAIGPAVLLMNTVLFTKFIQIISLLSPANTTINEMLVE
jgi:hypothetical protein